MKNECVAIYFLQSKSLALSHSAQKYFVRHILIFLPVAKIFIQAPDKNWYLNYL